MEPRRGKRDHRNERGEPRIALLALLVIVAFVVVILKAHNDDLQYIKQHRMHKTTRERRGKKEKFRPHTARKHSPIACRIQRPWLNGRSPTETGSGMFRFSLDRCEQLATRPKLFYFYAIITDAEARHIINASRALFQPKQPHKTGECDQRLTTFEGDGMSQRIARRVASITHIPVNHTHRFGITRCMEAQRLPSRHDGGVYQATFTVFLSDLPSARGGGAIRFPKSNPKGLAVYPRKRDALLWYNTNELGHKQELSTHEDLPITVKNHTKWMLSLYIKKDCATDCHTPTPIPSHRSPLMVAGGARGGGRSRGAKR